jgi:hypothetical protein
MQLIIGGSHWQLIDRRPPPKALPADRSFALNEGFLTVSATGVVADFAPYFGCSDQIL